VLKTCKIVILSGKNVLAVDLFSFALYINSSLSSGIKPGLQIPVYSFIFAPVKTELIFYILIFEQ